MAAKIAHLQQKTRMKVKNKGVISKFYNFEEVSWAKREEIGAFVAVVGGFVSVAEFVSTAEL